MMSPSLDEGERPADERLGRDVQHAGAVGRAAHARVRDAHHVADALPPAASSGSAACPIPACPGRRSAPRAAARAPSPASRRARIVDARRHVVVVAEHDGRPAMTMEQARLGGGVLDDGAVRREVAAKHRRARLRGDSGRSRGTMTRSLRRARPRGSRRASARSSWRTTRYSRSPIRSIRAPSPPA